ncbi:MAG: hypothetical protein KAI76_07545, partial [Alphaproteobacteria bacterium]|nr:hypothetical protein [Alphaproteobacteria bacterium]
MTKRINIFRVLSGFMRLISNLLGYWKLALIVAFFISPIGPHLRWKDTYHSDNTPHNYISCTYLGS